MPYVRCLLYRTCGVYSTVRAVSTLPYFIDIRVIALAVIVQRFVIGSRVARLDELTTAILAQRRNDRRSFLRLSRSDSRRLLEGIEGREGD
jgi:hypothetical protein